MTVGALNSPKAEPPFLFCKRASCFTKPANMCISMSASPPCIYMSDFGAASFLNSFLNAALPVLFAHGDTMLRKVVLPAWSYCHFPNTESSTEHLVVGRNCLCSSLGKSKALSFLASFRTSKYAFLQLPW